ARAGEVVRASHAKVPRLPDFSVVVWLRKTARFEMLKSEVLGAAMTEPYEPGAGRSRWTPAPWSRHRKPARRAGRMVPAIRQARARDVGTFLNRHYGARNRIFAARDRALNSAHPAGRRPDSEDQASKRPR